MTKVKEYKTATAFRRALEERLRNFAQAHLIDIQRLYRQVAFDRLLSRIFHQPASPYVLKGGYAMELRVEMARVTKDIDLSVPDIRLLSANEKEINQAVLDSIQAAAAINLNDYFQYVVGGPIQDVDGAPYGGARYSVDARMDARTFVKFHLDVGVGDAVSGDIEWLEAKDWLGFAGIAPMKFPTISKEQQFSEKLHAYTLPRPDRLNSRVKDLVDMVLLIKSGQMKEDSLSKALTATFERRKRVIRSPASFPLLLKNGKSRSRPWLRNVGLRKVWNKRFIFCDHILKALGPNTEVNNWCRFDSAPRLDPHSLVYRHRCGRNEADRRADGGRAAHVVHSGATYLSCSIFRVEIQVGAKVAQLGVDLFCLMRTPGKSQS